MKRKPQNPVFVIMLFIFMIILSGWLSFSTIRDTASDCINHGDVNHDRMITAADAQLVFFIVLGSYLPTYEEECAADCNGDNLVTAADAQAIFLVVLGLSECVDPIPVPTPTPVSMEFVFIPSGTYTRGSPPEEPCRLSNEGPQHQVTLTRGFYMMTTEVTRQMWADLKAMQPTLPSDPSKPCISPEINHPVQRNTWFESILFANLMSIQNGYTRCYYKDKDFMYPIDADNYTADRIFCDFNAGGYRLPTEAEWEYAARAGSIGPYWAIEPAYSTGNCSTCRPTPPLEILDTIAWWCGNAEGTAHPVAMKSANPWGLFDMHGNVWEWCWDFYNFYSSSSMTDPTGPLGGVQRIVRGGSWSHNASACRSAARYNYDPGNRYIYRGFRLVRTSDAKRNGHAQGMPLHCFQIH
jgi:formylglycine-generating enzyme required for sulfatase activity